MRTIRSDSSVDYWETQSISLVLAPLSYTVSGPSFSKRQQLMRTGYSDDLKVSTKFSLPEQRYVCTKARGCVKVPGLCGRGVHCRVQRNANEKSFESGSLKRAQLALTLSLTSRIFASSSQRTHCSLQEASRSLQAARNAADSSQHLPSAPTAPSTHQRCRRLLW